MTIGCSVRPSTLRARIAGAVILLPGTGDGVARLVDVSMVKVDMAQLSNDRAITPPVQLFRFRNEWNFAPAMRVETTGALAVGPRETIWSSFVCSTVIGSAT
jgi:hypothetical protein